MFWFKKARNAADFRPYMRRIADLTIPNLARVATEHRVENRYNRTFTVLIWPWLAGEGVTAAGWRGFTKDISDYGAGLVVTQPILTDEVLVAFFLERSIMEEPWFFLGSVTRNDDIGGGFWIAGVEWLEFMNEHRLREVAGLVEEAQSLLPRQSSKAICSD